MRIDVLTLFPNMFNSPFAESIVKRGIDEGKISLEYHNIRDFSQNKHNKVDDYPFGGGEGMLMQAEPVDLSIKKVKNEKSKIIYLTPSGKLLNQNIVKSLSEEEHLILLCGHYEGIDQRVLDKHEVMEISIGDYVLTGGEIPAMVLIDSISRMIPGVLPKEDSFKNESHYSGLLEHPQYTRPRVYEKREVPKVLLSGNHKEINKWCLYKSIEKTYKIRPDMLNNKILSKEEKEMLDDIKAKDTL